MRILELPRVAHVGDMLREHKKGGSNEGAGLSVSVHPIAWMQIHTIGDSGFILEGPGRFIDAMKMQEGEKTEIRDWAVDQGLVEQTVVYAVSHYDDELGRKIEFEMPTMEAARPRLRSSSMRRSHHVTRRWRLQSLRNSPTTTPCSLGRSTSRPTFSSISF